MRKFLTILAFLLALTASSLNFSEIDFLYGSGYGARVLDIADGDTLTVQHGKRKEKIRLYGIDCPEKLQEFGLQAKERTISLTRNQLVTIIPVQEDRYGRIVSFVITEDGRNLNYELISEGYAWWYRQYAKDDVKLAGRELVARAQKKGLWAGDDPMAPWEFRKGASSLTSSKDEPTF